MKITTTNEKPLFVRRGPNSKYGEKISQYIEGKDKFLLFSLEDNENYLSARNSIYQYLRRHNLRETVKIHGTLKTKQICLEREVTG